jgi:hypothetical protein
MDGHPCSKATLTSNKDTPRRLQPSLFSRCILQLPPKLRKKPSQSFLKKAIQGNYAEI